MYMQRVLYTMLYMYKLYGEMEVYMEIYITAETCV